MQRDGERLAGGGPNLPPAIHRDVTGALHDVSNALTVLLGWVAEARAASATPAQAERAMSIVEDRARVARDLARRAIGAEAVIDDREEPLDAMVSHVVETLRVEAQRAGVKLVVRSQTPAVRVPLPADASQVLTNVLLNALAWAPRGTQVSVETQADSAVATIAVQDEGPGVPATQAPFVFDGTSSREGGAGVGLRHARAVARAAGGELELVRRRRPSPRAHASGSAGPASRPRCRARPCPRRGRPCSRARASSSWRTTRTSRRCSSRRSSRAGRTSSSRVRPSSSPSALAETHDAALVDLSPIADDVRGAVDALRQGSPHVALVFISGSALGLPEGLDGETGEIRWVRKPFEVGEIVAALAETRRRGGAEEGREESGGVRGRRRGAEGRLRPTLIPAWRFGLGRSLTRRWRNWQTH